MTNRNAEEAAWAELDRLTDGSPGKLWRWSIPADPERDSDLILAAGLKAVADERDTALAALEAAEAALSAEKRDAALAEKHWHRDKADLDFIAAERDAAQRGLEQQRSILTSRYDALRDRHNKLVEKYNAREFALLTSALGVAK